MFYGISTLVGYLILYIKYISFVNKPEFICFHTAKWFQALQPNTNSFICTQLKSFKQCYLVLLIQFNINCFKWLNSSIPLIDETLTGITTRVQSKPGSKGNEGVIHIRQNSRTEESPLDAVLS